MTGPGADELVERVAKASYIAAYKLPDGYAERDEYPYCWAALPFDAGRDVWFDVARAAIAAMPKVPDRETVQAAIDVLVERIVAEEFATEPGLKESMAAVKQAEADLLAAIFGEELVHVWLMCGWVMGAIPYGGTV